MLNSFGTERGILTKRPRRKEGGGRAGHGLLFAYQLNIKQECFIVNDLDIHCFIVKMHTFIYL